MCLQVVGSLLGCGEGEVSSHCACSLTSCVSESWKAVKSFRSWEKLPSNKHETDLTNHSEEQKSVHTSRNRKGFGWDDTSPVDSRWALRKEEGDFA